MRLQVLVGRAQFIHRYQPSSCMGGLHRSNLFHLRLTVAPLEPDRVSVKGFRPPSPSKQSLDSRVFESEDSTPAHVISPRRPSRKSVESTEMKVRLISCR